MPDQYLKHQQKQAGKDPAAGAGMRAQQAAAGPASQRGGGTGGGRAARCHGRRAAMPLRVREPVCF